MTTCTFKHGGTELFPRIPEPGRQLAACRLTDMMKMKIFNFILTTYIFLGCITAGAVEITEISFAFIGNTDNDAYDGVAQGIHEANLQGRFLGQNYTLHEFSADDVYAIDPGMFIAIFVATNADDLRQAGGRFKDHAVFNVAVHDDALREACSSNLLHVIPSSKMLADAEAQWLQKSPGAEISVSGWHPDFVKFAARDLNKRYKKKVLQAHGPVCLGRLGRGQDDIRFGGKGKPDRARRHVEHT